MRRASKVNNKLWGISYCKIRYYLGILQTFGWRFLDSLRSLEMTEPNSGRQRWLEMTEGSWDKRTKNRFLWQFGLLKVEKSTET